jgi:hypothetical protein
MKKLIYDCISCSEGKTNYKFCSGNCDLSIEEVIIKIKNEKLQFKNDSHDVELFCKLSNARNYYNHYYTGDNQFSEIPFKLPIIRISKVRK